MSLYRSLREPARWGREAVRWGCGSEPL